MGELGHHRWQAPLAARPVSLRSPRRLEALVCLMQAALTAYQLLGRLYRRSVPGGARAAERRRTPEGLLREFRGYGPIERRTRLGRVAQARYRNGRQQGLLLQLGFPTPARLLAHVLPPLPHV